MSRIFGGIRQNGYVVHDIEAAMRHWTEVMGIGPWFYVERAPIRNFRYHGEASDIDLSIALANSGPLQIELIQQRNDAPSMYRDFLKAGLEGLQHVAYWTDEFETVRTRALDHGFTVGHEGENGDYGPFVYFDSAGHPGTVIELSDVGGPKKRLFQHIADASKDWGGADPIRDFPKVT